MIHEINTRQTVQSSERSASVADVRGYGGFACLDVPARQQKAIGAHLHKADRVSVLVS
jgi:hypothetical protein